VDPESIAVARTIGEQVLLDEHRCFVDEEADNSEHVPRIARIAESVRRALEREGCGAADADLVKRGLIDFGRALFVEEWMRPLTGDDEVPAEAEAIAEFERCLRERQR
jgi:hypothetical protein